MGGYVDESGDLWTREDFEDMDELDKIRADRDEARRTLLDLLRAPWNRMSPWAISRACAYLEHPPKHQDQPERGCACGKERDQLRVEPAKKREIR